MIELGTLALLSALGGAAVVPATVVVSRVTGWLGRRRNRKDLCARCRGRLYGDSSGPWRMGGVLYCGGCAEVARRSWAMALWTGVGAGLGLALFGALGVAGLLPFVASGLSIGALAGLLVPPLAVGGAAWFQLSHAKRANARTELEAAKARLPEARGSEAGSAGRAAT